MKSTIFSLMIGLMFISVVHASAQGRGRDREGDRERNESKDRYANNSHDRRSDRDWDERGGRSNGHYHGHHDKGYHRGHDRNRNNHYHDRRVVRHVHVHDRYCHRKPVVVHHRYSRPRYVYYRDYDVYYDYSRNVYFSYSGRNWTMTTGVPVGMRHVNLRSVKRYEVDYYDDDFTSYLDTGRPEYGRECDW